jgi:hypothetical protein
MLKVITREEKPNCIYFDELTEDDILMVYTSDGIPVGMIIWNTIPMGMETHQVYQVLDTYCNVISIGSQELSEGLSFQAYNQYVQKHLGDKCNRCGKALGRHYALSSLCPVQSSKSLTSNKSTIPAE